MLTVKDIMTTEVITVSPDTEVLEATKLLLENGADWKMVDIDGDTAKKFASNNGHGKVVELIESHAAKQL